MTAEDFIQHWSDEPYDPAQAHAYYLATRQLKGRQPGAQQSGSTKVPGPKLSPAAKTVKAKTALSSPSKAQLQSQVSDNVAALEARLGRLKMILAKLLSESERKSTKTDAHEKSKDSGVKKPESAREKSDKKEYSKTHEKAREVDKTKSHSPAQNKEIAAVRAQISKIHSELTSAIQSAQNAAAKSAIKH